MDGPFLWYLNRGTGLVLLVLLTVTVVVGVLATRGRPGRVVPRFVVQTLHRDLAVLSVGLLTVHVLSAVLDEYVDIRWWQVLVPVGSTYEPFWLGLGTVATQLLGVVVLSSALRRWMSLRAWRALHLSVHLAWVLSVAHGLGIGTDTRSPAAAPLYLACIGAVAVAVLLRLGGLAIRGRRAPLHGGVAR
ncbi:MAG TPA: ferric reductase [Nocardioides sp.]|nr:ferric reductase [Nocardioides sp.]